MHPASVLGFREVARLLAVYGAPERLIGWARRSAREEIDHARSMRREATRRGAAPRGVRAAARHNPSLFEFARENLIAGCVDETYSALELVFMADHAPDDLRPIFARVAKDELAHAGLGFEIQAWALPRLTIDERRALAEALADALRSLAALSFERSPEIVALGVPSPIVAQALARSLIGMMFGAAQP